MSGIFGGGASLIGPYTISGAFNPGGTGQSNSTAPFNLLEVVIQQFQKTNNVGYQLNFWFNIINTTGAPKSITFDFDVNGNDAALSAPNIINLPSLPNPGGLFAPNYYLVNMQIGLLYFGTTGFIPNLQQSRLVIYQQNCLAPGGAHDISTLDLTAPPIFAAVAFELAGIAVPVVTPIDFKVIATMTSADFSVNALTNPATFTGYPISVIPPF